MSERDNVYDYVLSIDSNDLIVYKKDSDNRIISTFICQNCIMPKSKKTARLLYGIQGVKNLSIKIAPNPNGVMIHVSHPLYDDEIYIMRDKHLSGELGSNSYQMADSTPLFYVYVLELEQDKFYVGKSSNPISRVGEHIATTLFGDNVCNSGSGWTKMYPPVRILEVIPSHDEFDEDKTTLQYMKLKGIDNVRGGSFCELNLSRENIVTLEKMLAGADNKCYYCGKDDHFINSCPQKNHKRVAQKQKKQKIKIKDIPKSKIAKYYSAQKLLQNSSINIKKVDTNMNQSSHNTETFPCQYCDRVFDSEQKKKNHENITCTQSENAHRGKLMEARVDAILDDNAKYRNTRKIT